MKSNYADLHEKAKRTADACLTLKSAKNMALPPPEQGASPDGTRYTVPPGYTKALTVQRSQLEMQNAVLEARKEIVLNVKI